jgi:hypothetical protein
MEFMVFVVNCGIGKIIHRIALQFLNNLVKNQATMKLKLGILFLVCVNVSCTHNEHDSDLLVQLMEAQPAKFNRFLQQKDSLEIQILYTQIDRDSVNKPVFRTYAFNEDPDRYFYPASTVKLPLVLLSLEKLRALNLPGLDLNTPMLHDSIYSGQASIKGDSTSESGLPSISHYSKKILVVSDNDAFNRLYEFMGQESIRDRLVEKGYGNMRVVHRLERSLTRDENQHTESIRFVRDGKVIFQQPMLFNKQPVFSERPIFKGTGFMRNDSLIEKPFEFTYKNFFTLRDQQAILKNLLFPSQAEAQEHFKISDDDRLFVLKYMSQLPTETSFPPYRTDTTYYDAFCKFLLYGSERAEIPPHIRIFNKVGDAYGYLIDNAYVVDFDNGIEFILSAVINTNTDGIYNDSKYEYKTLGFPFMRDLGQMIYQYELSRPRKFKPDLSEFRFTYDH